MIPSNENIDGRWLATSEGLEGLAKLQELPEGNHAAVAKGVKLLRRDFNQDQWLFLTDQIELRKRAASKFELASQMLFTRRSLEQATDDRIGAWKGARFFAAGAMVDFCCGIGGDLATFALRSDVTGVDSDPLVSEFAAHNVRVYQNHAAEKTTLVATPAAKVVCQTVESFTPLIEATTAWHLDPDRRFTGARTTQLEFQEPSGEVIEALLQKHPHGLIKLAPATEVPEAWLEQSERTYVASRGECRQLLVAFGKLAQRPGLRQAVVMDRSASALDAVPKATLLLEDADAERVLLPIAGEVQQFVYEPSAAVLGAQLSRSLCKHFGLQGLADRVAYFTGSEKLESDLVTGFRVRDVLPLDRKKLKAYLRERGLADLEIKKRGCEIDPQRLRKELKVDGDQKGVLLIAPFGGRVQAIVAERLVAIP